jgi:hypothetical protein
VGEHVVGAEAQGAHAVRLVVARGHHHHAGRGGAGAPLAQRGELAQHVQPVHVGEGQRERGEGHRAAVVVGDARHQRPPALDPLDLVPFDGEVRGQVVGGRGVRVGEDDARHGRKLHPRRPAAAPPPRRRARRRSFPGEAGPTA